MGNQQLVCGVKQGEKRAGESFVMRSPMLKEGEDLKKDFQGMTDLKSIIL